MEEEGGEVVRQEEGQEGGVAEVQPVKAEEEPAAARGQEEAEEEAPAPAHHEDEDDDYWKDEGGEEEGEPRGDGDGDGGAEDDEESQAHEIRQSLLALNALIDGNGDEEAADEEAAEEYGRESALPDDKQGGSAAVEGAEPEREQPEPEVQAEPEPAPEQHLTYDEQYRAEEEERLDGTAESLAEMLEDAEEERRMLRDVNEELKHRVEELWARDPHSRPNLVEERVASNDAVSRDQIRIQHAKSLDQANSLIESIAQRQDAVDRRVDRLNARLDSFDEQATELCESLKAFKRAIARGAEYSRSGKKIKFKRILALEAAEEEKDKEVETHRLKNIHYLNQLSKLEQDLKRKEELADGLHLIDFEQLKIENCTLSEKVEERNDELQKLEKKSTTTVQVLTHVKEKLTFVRGEHEGLVARVAGLDEQVVAMRDRLTKAKHERDALRRENGVLKQKQGFIGSDLLVADWQRTKGESEQLEAQVAALRERHARIMAAVRRAEGQQQK